VAPPFAGGFQAHNIAAQSYFVSAGIPADQVLGVSGSTKLTGAGYAGGPQPTPKIVGYESTVARSAGGFHVVESFAEAQINANNEVVRESVYWPPLPAYLIDDATKIATVLADPTDGPAFLATLSVQGSANVAIHHTTGFLSEAMQFVAFASCDVHEPGGMAHHFDLSGNELFTPQEAIQPPDAPRRTLP
jgi:hypothetical protein